MECPICFNNINTTIMSCCMQELCYNCYCKIINGGKINCPFCRKTKEILKPNIQYFKGIQITKGDVSDIMDDEIDNIKHFLQIQELRPILSDEITINSTVLIQVLNVFYKTLIINIIDDKVICENIYVIHREGKAYNGFPTMRVFNLSDILSTYLIT